MKIDRVVNILELLVVFSITVVGMVEGQEWQDTPSVDPFTRDLQRNETHAAELIAQVINQKDPIIRFMTCLEKVINVNKGMSNGAKLPEISSSFADDPKSSEDQEKLLARLSDNREND